MKTTTIIILAIVACVIFSGVFFIPVSSASIFKMNKSADAGATVLDYYDALKEKNVRYAFNHIAKFQDALARMHRENPKKNWGEIDRQVFLGLKEEAEKNPETFWADWLHLLDGTRVSVDEVRRLGNEEASEMGIKNRDEVYQVFVHFSFTKRSSSVFDQKDAVLLKEFVFQVFVYYDHGRMLVDTERISDVRTEHRMWGNDV